MAGRGPVPKPTDRKRRPPKEHRAEVDAPPVEFPGLPGGPWREETVRWYATWCSAAQASVFTVTDWQRLHMLAPLVDSYWEEPNVRVFGEIRLNESLLNATVGDRSRSRLDIKPAKPADTKPAAASSDDPRDRLRVVAS